MDGGDGSSQNGHNQTPPAKITKFRNVVSINNDSDEDIIITSNEANLSSSVRRRVQISNEKIQTGSLNILSAKYESLDYDTCENYLLLDEERKKGYKFIVQKSIARWFVFLLIGMLTAIIACIIDISVEELSRMKYRSLSKCILF
ncbi:unnamed protein product [Acanthoscelides obtectus]|uniref:Uncharacterized protein n=1 Tax=Acanthoscelides obtectus TaxID=200917 RepID=A0A9P0JXI3_ACAOB|nr:unnamed protein product [Acanthoscelides obtectus]CAK1663727.1 H(+)/Cl(-) exchange transporter 7 [Acanthoscelides obtectus]